MTCQICGPRWRTSTSTATWMIAYFLLANCSAIVNAATEFVPKLVTGGTAAAKDGEAFQPTYIMTDQILPQAVDLWFDNPTLALQYFGPIGAWNTSAVTNFRALFRGRKKFNEPIGGWDTSKATSMAAMFEEAYAFNQDLSGWDTSNVLSMSAMFADAVSFTGTKGGAQTMNWNVEKVTRMDRMFHNAILFQGDLSHWRTTKVHHVADMFHNAINYQGGQDLELWDTREFRDLTGMFQHAIRFNGNISTWNTNNVIEMDEMFHNAIEFNQDLSRWNTSNVITMARMFRNATKFTGLGLEGGIGQWNVENVRNFYAMFEDNPSFQSDISPWNPANAHNMERMFYNATAFGKNHPLKETISEHYNSNPNSPFKLFCWPLPNAQVKTQDAFCGSNVRFDPCCATTTQLETSCCNQFCYNMTTTCQYPQHDQGAANQNHYSISSERFVHDDDQYYDDDDDEDVVVFDPSNNLRGKVEQGKTEKTILSWEGIVMIIVLLLIVMCCFWAMVKYL